MDWFDFTVYQVAVTTSSASFLHPWCRQHLIGMSSSAPTESWFKVPTSSNSVLLQKRNYFSAWLSLVGDEPALRAAEEKQCDTHPCPMTFEHLHYHVTQQSTSVLGERNWKQLEIKKKKIIECYLVIDKY